MMVVVPRSVVVMPVVLGHWTRSRTLVEAVVARRGRSAVVTAMTRRHSHH